MEFSLNLNLQGMAALQYAIFLWEQPRFRVRRVTFFNSKGSLRAEEWNWETWNGLTQDVLKEIQGKGLPFSVSEYLVNVVISIGKKIYYWGMYVKRKLQIDVSFAHNLCWTSYGTIDRSKVIKLKWMKDPYLASDCGPSLCFAASTCAMLDYLKEKSDVVLDSTDNYFGSDDTSQNLMYRYLASSMLYLNVDLSNLGEEVDESWLNPSNRTKAGNMFRQSVIEGCVESVKYYWNAMDAVDQEAHLIPSVKKCIDLFHRGYYRKKTKCLKEYRIEILTFLLNEMSETEREKLLEKFAEKILEMYIYMWPWQEFYMPIFDLLKNRLSVDKMYSIFYKISSLLEEFNCKQKYSIDGSIYQNLFSRVWNATPAKKKLKLVKSEKRGKRKSFLLDSSLKHLFESFDLVNLNLIINDECLKGKREKLIMTGKETFKQWIEEGKYSFLEKFMNEVLTSDEERKKFKLQMNFYDYFIEKDKFTIVDKLLNWQSDSQEERMLIKNQIDPTPICKSLIGKSYDFNKHLKLADKYLLWQYDSVDDRVDVKNRLKSEKFVSKKFGELWCRRGNKEEKAKEELTTLMVWLNSNKEITFFKKDIISDCSVIEEILRALPKTMSLYPTPIAMGKGKELSGAVVFEAINSFLKFCLATEAEINKIKWKINVNVDWWIKEFGIKMKNFVLIDGLLDWACNSEQKQKIIKTYMRSRNGSSLCHKLFDKLHIMGEAELQKFLNTWVKSSGNVTGVKNGVIKLDDKLKAKKTLPRRSLYDRSGLISLLDELERNGHVDLGKKKKCSRGSDL